MQIKKALLAGAKDPKGRFRVIRGIGFGGLPTDIQHPILEGYFLGDLLVWVVGGSWLCRSEFGRVLFLASRMFFGLGDWQL